MTDNAILPSARLLNLRAFMLAFLLAVYGLLTPVWVQAQEQTEPAQETAAGYEALAQVLGNEQLRTQLIEQLRALAAEQDGSLVQEPGSTVLNTVSTQPELIQASDTNELVWRLQSFAQHLRSDVVQTWQVLRQLGRGDPASVQSLQNWLPALINLLITILVAGLAFLCCRWLAKPVFRRFDTWAKKVPSFAPATPDRPDSAPASKELDEIKEDGTQMTGDFAHLQVASAESMQSTATERPPYSVRHYLLRYGKLRKLVAVLGAFFIDVLLIFAAALVAYVVAVALPNSGQQTTLFSLQFLTAFVGVELIKVVSRGIFATGYDQLRLLPINNDSAAYWNRWVSTVVVVGGYGLLVLVPVLQAILSPAFANVMGAVLILVVYIYAVGVLWSRRHAVTDTLLKQAEHADGAFSGTLLRIIARVWVWLALLYLTVLFFVTQGDQQNALSFMAKASGQTLLALLLGGVASLVLSSLLSHRLHLSARWNHAFPLLEERLNSYVPVSLRALRLLVLVSVLVSIFDAWNLVDLRTWFSSGQGQLVINTVVRVAVVLIIAAMTWTILASIIEHRLSASNVRMPTEREKTLLMLFRNALAIVILTMTVLIVLSQVGIDIGPLIAGAGVVGLAIGFGAQKLVQDVITGVFIQLENGMNQNDVVEVAGLFGVVEKLTIRSVVIRTLDGGYHLVPFSAIDCVANHTRDYGYHYGEYCVGLRESVDEAIACLRLAFVDTKQDPEVASAILEDISIPGVTSLNREGFTIRVLIKTAPGMQWAVQRSFNRWVKIHFDAAGIELPYPHTVLHFGRDKNGYASPADIRMVDAVAQNSRGAEVVPPAGQTLRPLSTEA